MPDFNFLHQMVQEGRPLRDIANFNDNDRNNGFGFIAHDLIRLFGYYMNEQGIAPENIPGVLAEEVLGLIQAVAELTGNIRAIRQLLHGGLSRAEIINLNQFRIEDINAAQQPDIQLNNQQEVVNNNRNAVNEIVEHIRLVPNITDEQLFIMQYTLEDIQTARLILQNEETIQNIVNLIINNPEFTDAYLENEMRFTAENIQTARQRTGIPNPINQNQGNQNQGNQNQGNQNQGNQNQDNQGQNPQITIPQVEQPTFISGLFSGWTPVVIFGPIVALITYLWYKKAPAKKPAITTPPVITQGGTTHVAKRTGRGRVNRRNVKAPRRR